MDAVEKLYQISPYTRLSVKHRYLCVAVPKVACSTIKRTLHAFEGLEVTPVDELWRVHHMAEEMRARSFSPEQIREMLNSEDWFRFTFVRNPYARILSAWKSKIRSGDPQYLWIQDHIRTAKGLGCEDDISFGDFVDVITSARSKVIRDEGHWIPQNRIVYPRLIDYDVIGRFENFAEDFDTILTMLKAPKRVRDIARQVTNPTSTFGGAYTQEIADKVYSRYRFAFREFGYDRDSWKNIPG